METKRANLHNTYISSYGKRHDERKDALAALAGYGCEGRKAWRLSRDEMTFALPADNHRSPERQSCENTDGKAGWQKGNASPNTQGKLFYRFSKGNIFYLFN